MSATDLLWFKSSYSGTDGDNCVEVAVSSEGVAAVHVRDSKDVALPHLSVSRAAWASFVDRASC